MWNPLAVLTLGVIFALLHVRRSVISPRQVEHITYNFTFALLHVRRSVISPRQVERITYNFAKLQADLQL